MTTIFIDGEAGTTGLGIRQRLATLPIHLLSIDPTQRKNPAARQNLMAEADIVILCLPDDAARQATQLATALNAHAPRILDASSAHRTSPGWTYGFPELTQTQPAAIANATHVSNPGCYATGAIALLRPLVDAGLIPASHPLTINAVSGYSGGGHQMIEAHETQHGPAFELYALSLEHKHTPEIMHHAGLSTRPLFVPSVGHFPQGMLVSIPLHLDQLPNRPTAADLRATLAAHYAASPTIELPATTPARLQPDTLANTDRVQLHILPGPANQALLVASLDNLGKGASGAAVQNLRLMLNLPEEPTHG